MTQEVYGHLEKIVNDTINQTILTGQFNLIDFIQNMETEFTRLGFREPSTRGGVQKILILRLDAIGDFILTTPSIRAIRENFPNAHITLVVTKAVYPMAELCPYVNEVIIFEMTHKTSLLNEDLFTILRNSLNFSMKYLLKNHYNICFSFLYDTTHYVMSYMSGAMERVGYFANNNIYRIFLSKPIFVDYSKVHQYAEKNLYFIQTYGLKIQSTDLELWYDNEDLRIAKNLLKDFAPNRLKIAFGLGANNPERRYPVEKYLVALKEIIAKGAAIVLLGGPSEIDDAKFLEDNLPKEYVRNLVEVHAGWRVDSAVISQTDIYLGNDTGTQHIAAALKKPVILLTRDSKDRLRAMGAYCECIMFYPYQTKSITLMPEHSIDDCAKKLTVPCFAGKPHCIAQIEPSEIVDAYEKILR